MAQTAKKNLLKPDPAAPTSLAMGEPCDKTGDNRNLPLGFLASFASSGESRGKILHRSRED